MSSTGEDELPEPEVGAEQIESSLHSQANSQVDDAEHQLETVSGAEDDTSSYEDDDHRENRFQGAESNWRFFTRDERGLAASLERQRANDLSVHLYNAHALKARLYRADAAPQPWHSKQRWIRSDEDGDLPWRPDRNWTAWPLPPDDVPRPEEAFGSLPLPDDEEAMIFRKAERWIPSSDLREEIQAIMLRKAGDRFERRRLADVHDALPDTARIPLQRKSSTDSSPDRRSPNSNQSPTPIEGTEIGGSPDYQQLLPVADPTYVPAMSADDDQAHAILQPSVQHIIAQFNSLLLGLHKSRLGHHDARDSRSRSEASSPRPDSRSRSRITMKRDFSREPLPKQKPKVFTDGRTKHRVTDDEARYNRHDHAERGSSVHHGRSRSRPASSRRQPGLRDWSEVLGIATLVGWDPTVVDRAAHRCASLFGEGMAFRMMPERSADTSAEEVTQYLPEDNPPLDLDVDDTTEVNLNPNARAYCPYTDCPRHQALFTQARRWREHLKRRHGLNSEQVEKIETGLMHPEGPSAQVSPSRSSSDEDREGPAADDQIQSEEADDDDLSGGVHVDGFLQPVRINLGRGPDVRERRKRSRSSREGSKRRRLGESTDEEVDAAG